MNLSHTSNRALCLEAPAAGRGCRFVMELAGYSVRCSKHVGYESSSQFSREYGRLFGVTPKRDINGLRRSAVT